MLEVSNELDLVIADLRVAIALDKENAKKNGLPPAEECLKVEAILDALYDAQKDVEDYVHEFNMRMSADWRAIKRWRAATGRTRVIPDHENLVVFLLEQIDKLEDELECLKNSPEKNLQKSDGMQPVDSGSQKTKNVSSGLRMP